MPHITMSSPKQTEHTCTSMPKNSQELHRCGPAYHGDQARAPPQGSREAGVRGCGCRASFAVEKALACVRPCFTLAGGFDYFLVKLVILRMVLVGH